MTRAKLAKPRILIVGCGDVGLRTAHLLNTRFRIFALVRNLHQRPDEHARLAAAGIVPLDGDLDQPASLHRLAGLASQVLHLAPPPLSGSTDPRTHHLLAALGKVERLVYVSTTGVYGNCHGAHINETRTPQPQTVRAQRRVDAETRLRRWARKNGTQLTILRVPGIYAADRLPLARLQAGTPALQDEDDPYTNHIHADDLARSIAAALYHGATQRIYHASDNSVLKMGEYFDLVADTFGSPRPPRLPRDELVKQVSSNLLSFMSESRRLDNTRLKAELGVVLRYQTVQAGVLAAREHLLKKP